MGDISARSVNIFICKQNHTLTLGLMCHRNLGARHLAGAQTSVVVFVPFKNYLPIPRYKFLSKPKTMENNYNKRREMKSMDFWGHVGYRNKLPKKLLPAKC